MRKPVIGVMGGALVDATVTQTARQLGRLIAQRGWILLTGGRNAGVMAAASNAAREAGGTVIGILPDRDASDASPDLHIAVVTGMGDARNVINVLTSDVVIACPGGAGTVSEVALALKNSTPVILLGLTVGPALDAYRRSGLLTDANDPAGAVEHAAQTLGSKNTK